MVKIPKRNKSKDNPYKLIYNEETEKYIVEFADNKKVVHKVEVSRQVYLAFDRFELEDISQIHKYRKHIEHSEMTEETLYNRLFEPLIGVEEIVEKKEIEDELKKAIDTLTEIQKRRIKMYYFENMKLQEIAKLENCSIKNISKSLEQAREKLKRNLKK